MSYTLDMTKVLQDEIYLHISSRDVSNFLIPDNISSRFTVELPTTLILEGYWEMALIEFTCVFTPGIKYGDSVQILCDVIDPSPMKDKWIPLLRNITFSGNVRRPEILLDYRYTRLVHTSIKRIGLHILVSSDKAILDERSPSFCVLHLRKTTR
jgi:hypothetical protein